MDDNKNLQHTIHYLILSSESLNVRKAFLDSPPQQLDPYKFITQPISSHEIRKMEGDLARMADCNIHFINYGDSLYPSQLRLIPDPPLVLFFMGDIANYNFRASSWAIVGARKASPEGLALSNKIASLLATRGQKIISGLAIGIDSSAHHGALESGAYGSTLGILGNGLPSIYPVCNQRLAKKIVANGGLICSQFYPFSRAYPANFLNRNRVISGLADNILVIEAGEHSGSKVTARYALEQGKNLYVIPGDIFNKKYQGSNQLIKQGAEIITSLDDFEELVPSSNFIDIKALFSDSQQMILNQLSKQATLSIIELSSILVSKGLELDAFYRELYMLEDQGKIRILPGDIVQVY